MNILFLLIPISLVLLSLAIWAFFWAVKHDQFEDLEGPAYSILFDDEDEVKKPQDQDASTETTDDTPEDQDKPE